MCGVIPSFKTYRRACERSIPISSERCFSDMNSSDMFSHPTTQALDPRLQKLQRILGTGSSVSNLDFLSGQQDLSHNLDKQHLLVPKLNRAGRVRKPIVLHCSSSTKDSIAGQRSPPLIIPAPHSHLFGRLLIIFFLQYQQQILQSSSSVKPAAPLP